MSKLLKLASRVEDVITELSQKAGVPEDDSPISQIPVPKKKQKMWEYGLNRGLLGGILGSWGGLGGGLAVDNLTNSSGALPIGALLGVAGGATLGGLSGAKAGKRHAENAAIVEELKNRGVALPDVKGSTLAGLSHGYGKGQVMAPLLGIPASFAGNILSGGDPQATRLAGALAGIPMAAYGTVKGYSSGKEDSKNSRIIKALQQMG